MQTRDPVHHARCHHIRNRLWEQNGAAQSFLAAAHGVLSLGSDILCFQCEQKQAKVPIPLPQRTPARAQKCQVLYRVAAKSGSLSYRFLRFILFFFLGISHIKAICFFQSDTGNGMFVKQHLFIAAFC